ncbi:MAG: NrtA/SsuA/CpmA family ABC transporter substrate-binding protein [Sulfuricellaceae bacterium]
MKNLIRSRAGRAWALIAIVVLALFVLQATGWVNWSSFRMFERVEHLRLGAYEGDVGALEWIAQEQGFYDQIGLAVEIKGYPSGKEAADALKAGQVDVATASEYVVASRSFSEPDLRILGNIAYYRNKGIIGRRDRGIGAPADLKGKRIGVTSPSGAEYTLNIFLALHGLTVQDVTVVNLSPKQIVDAMETGGIDAAITWQPHVQAIEKKLGDNAISFQGEGLDTYLLVLVTLKDNLASSNGALNKLMRALVLAEEWVLAHPSDAKRYIAKRFSLDAAYVEAIWNRMQLAVTLPQELLIAMDSEARWLSSRERQSGAIPNFSGFIWAGPLTAANPLAVTLYTDTKPPGNTPPNTPSAER